MKVLKLCVAVLIAALLSLAVVGCKGARVAKGRTTQPAPTKTLVILVDLSGTTFPYRREYLEDIKPFLARLDYGDVVLISEIVGNSLQDARVIVEEKLPVFMPRTAADNPFLGENPLLTKAKRLKADKALTAQRHKFEIANNINRIRDDIAAQVERVLFSRDTNETDIFGALQFADRVFSARGGDKTLVIVSDMIVETDRYNFKHDNLTLERIADIIKQERTTGRMPDLNGVTVFVLGAKAADKGRFYGNRDFWLSYFKAAGADSDANRYGGRMPDLILDKQ